MENQIKYCHWFADNNKYINNPKTVKKCRYGIRCNYLHLSLDEVNKIKTSGNEIVSCSCKEQYEDEQIDESKFDISSEGLKILKEFMKEYKEQTICSLCKGTEKLKLSEYILNEAKKRVFTDCSCDPIVRKRRGTVYYPKNSVSRYANCMICNNCNCIISFG